MKNYELVAIIKDNEVAINDSKKVIDDLLKANDIKITNQDTWGSKELAYPIKKENTGYYIIYYITGEGKAVKAIESTLRIKENIIRFRVFTEIKRQVIKKRRRKNERSQ